MSRSGRTLSAEARAKISEAKKRTWADPAFREKRAATRVAGPDEWSAEQIERLKALRLEGRSSGEMAALLPFSRSAICGKMQRLGLTFLAHQGKVVRGEAAVDRAPEARPQAWPDPGMLAGTPLHGIGPRQCHWPLWHDEMPGAPGYGLFCAAVTEAGQTYCAAHGARAGADYGQPRPQRKTLGRRG